MAGTLAAATIAGVAIATPKPETQDLKTDAIHITAVPISGFDRTDRAKTQFGKLQWRGGLVLTSETAAFGGWSGIAVDNEGKGFVAVSDAGTWMTGTLDYDDRRVSGLSGTVLGPITGPGGKALDRNRLRDAEAVTLAAGTLSSGTLLIAFEQKNRIGRFKIGKDGVSAPFEHLTMPPQLQKRRGTDGIEAVTVLRGGPLKGAVIAVAETVRNKDGAHTGWIWSGKAPRAFNITDIGEFNVTDAASLDNGDLLILERRFRWSEGVKVRLRRVPAAEVKPGAVLTGEVLMAAEGGTEIDNLEGLAVHTDAKGETIVTMISDDNFNRVLQRTLLLQFAITGEEPERTAGQ